MANSLLNYPASEHEMEREHVRAQGPTKAERQKEKAVWRHRKFLAAATEKGRDPAQYTREWRARIGLTVTEFGLLASELNYLLGLGPQRDRSDGTPVPTAPLVKLQRNGSFHSTDSLLLFWLRCLQASAVAKPAKPRKPFAVAQECGLTWTQLQANTWATRMDLWGPRLLTMFLRAGKPREFKVAMKVAHFSPRLAALTQYRQDECDDRNAIEEKQYRTDTLPPVPAWVVRLAEEHLAKEQLAQEQLAKERLAREQVIKKRLAKLKSAQPSPPGGAQPAAHPATTHQSNAKA